MSDSQQSAISADDTIALEEAHLTALAQELDVKSRRHILVLAEAEGWSAEQAAWIEALAKGRVFDAAMAGKSADEVVAEAYHIGRRRLIVLAFDDTLQESGNPIIAFHTVFDLQRELAERRGEPPPAYSEAALIAACRAVAQAASEGLSSEEQIGRGFGALGEATEHEATSDETQH